MGVIDTFEDSIHVNFPKEIVSCHLERRVLYCTSADECYDDRYDIDSELELKKLGDTVIHIPAPHHCFHDAAEVVIG